MSDENDTVIVPAGPARAEVDTQTILIVDDDRSVADTFARLLKLEGFGVATALSADTALEVATTIRPDAIILDMRMPVASGLKVLRDFRKHPALAHTPVAIVTGDYFLADAVLQELRALGAAIKFKPLFFEDLIALARTLVSPAA